MNESAIRALVEEFGTVEDDGRLTLDSFAVINVVEALEDRYGVHLRADELSRERFATLSALTSFVTEKLGSRA